MGTLYVGCAGGEDTILNLPVEWQKPAAGLDKFKLKVSGLTGGHSGVDIHQNRANAVKLLALTLKEFAGPLGHKLAAVNGGTKKNAIPRDAEALLFLAKADLAKARGIVEERMKSFKAQFGDTDPTMKIELEPASEPCDKCMTDASRQKLVDLMLALPNGVMMMSQEIPGLVHTSTPASCAPRGTRSTSGTRTASPARR